MQPLKNCGCCEGLSTETPLKIHNRPGLTALSYRVGVHAQFRESLLARLTTSGLEALRNLTTRENDDFTIALLDAWATVCDVLTFYQERIANESYLGTATEQLSVVELARLIGYELRPGVAASTYLAFTVEEATLGAGLAMVSGIPRSKEESPPVTVPTGTQVKSVPGPDEEPQTFETIEAIEARGEWNAIKPRQTQPQLTLPDNTVVVLKGTDNDLDAGDILLIVEEGGTKKMRKILKVALDENAKTTTVYLDVSPVFPPFATPPPYVPDGNVDHFAEKTELSESVVDYLLGHTWREPDLAALILAQGWPIVDVKESISAALAKQASSVQVFVVRRRAAAFGYNALKQVTYNTETGAPDLPSAWEEWELAELPGIIYLDSTYEDILPGSYVAVQHPDQKLDGATVYQVDEVDIRPRTAYGMSSKSTRLTLSPSQDWWEDEGKDPDELSSLRSLTIYVQTEPLTLAETPLEEPVEGETVMLSGFFPGLKAEQTVLFSGERNDPRGAFATEVKQIEEVLVVNGFTVLVFEDSLSYAYVRRSVAVNANVASATHGETVKEVLGGGDAGRAFQKFVLKQPPLTFTSSATPSGAASTLEIRVNDVLWHEVPSFYGRGPEEHIYTTRLDDQGKTTVIFGDGKTGARLPGGPDNIRATYRRGIGLGGGVDANQLSQLVTRPLGVKAVTNPVKAGGAQDRELLADARTNATLTIFTLDRIVSLQDYEDFARAFAGIAKALATWTWSGRKRAVHLTVAGYDGAEVDPDSNLFEKLSGAIQNAGIPQTPVIIESYRPVYFRLTAKIQVHPDYLSEKVLPAVEQRLREYFSFAQRQFGQSVPYSEVVSVMQNVEGVTAVDVDEFYRTDEAPDVRDRLDADAPRPGGDQPFPAELLTIDPRPIDLKTMP